MQAFFDYILKYIQLIRITDIIDIFVVSVIVYYILTIVKETRAKQLIKGIGLVFAVFFISQWMHLNALNYILSATLQVGAFALDPVHQAEVLAVRVAPVPELLDVPGVDDHQLFHFRHVGGENRMHAHLQSSAISIVAAALHPPPLCFD